MPGKIFLILIIICVIGINVSHAHVALDKEEEILFFEEEHKFSTETEILDIATNETICDTSSNVNISNLNLLNFQKQDFYKFRPQQLILPGILLGVGIVGIWSFDGLKNHIHNNWSIVKYEKKVTIDNYLQYSHIPFYIGLGFIPGVPHRSEWRERLMAGVSAYGVMTILTNIMKYSFKVKRPDSSSRNSFPSGHTATAFTGAELMRIEYGNWIGLAGYLVAGTVAALRIYNDRHWLSDVLGGAGIGILSARIGYWLVPWERKLFKLDKKNNLSVVAMPLVGSSNGIALMIDF